MEQRKKEANQRRSSVEVPRQSTAEAAPSPPRTARPALSEPSGAGPGLRPSRQTNTTSEREPTKRRDINSGIRAARCFQEWPRATHRNEGETLKFLVLSCELGLLTDSGDAPRILLLQNSGCVPEIPPESVIDRRHGSTHLFDWPLAPGAEPPM